MTIYDIAKEAGVSASTVSRVINNRPGIKAATREKVRLLLEKYNYSPDVAARGLVMQSTKMVGILIVDIRDTHHINSAFQIEEALAKKGYCCIIMSTGPDDDIKAEYLRIFEQRRVEGIILMSSMFMSEKVKDTIRLHLSRIPIVIVNGYLDLPNVSCVIADEAKGITDCVRLLAAKNRKKIVFVFNCQSPSALNKYAGYCAGMREQGFSDDDLISYHTEDSSVQSGYRITETILREHPDTDAIIYAVEIIAVGGIRAAQDLGFRIPDQIAMIGVDNSIYGQICYPRLTTLDNRMVDMNLTAANILQEGLEGSPQNKKLFFDCKIIEREST